MDPGSGSQSHRQDGRPRGGGGGVGADVRLLNAPWTLEQRSEDGDSHGSEGVGGEETRVRRQAREEEAGAEADAWGAAFLRPLQQGPGPHRERPRCSAPSPQSHGPDPSPH